MKLGEITAVSNLIGGAFESAFGHPYIAGAFLFGHIFYTLYRFNVPADAAVVIAVPILLGFTGVFLPSWVLPIIVMSIAIISALGLMKVLGVV